MGRQRRGRPRERPAPSCPSPRFCLIHPLHRLRGSTNVSPPDRARLRAESSEDRSMPSAVDVYRPAASNFALDADDGARPGTVNFPPDSNGDTAHGSQPDRPEDVGAVVTIVNNTWHSMRFALNDGVPLGHFVLDPAESF